MQVIKEQILVLAKKNVKKIKSHSGLIVFFYYSLSVINGYSFVSILNKGSDSQT